MKNLLLSSLVCLLSMGCNSGHYKRFEPYPDQSLLKPIPLKPVFEDSFNSFLFKTNIQLYTKAFSGLLITKQIEPGYYRVILTSEMGMKLFDFEFRDTSFKVHYCVSQFNKPVVLKTIKKDIEILLMNNLREKHMQILSDNNHTYTIYKTDDEKDFNYYFIENSSKKISRIEHAGKKTKKISYSLENYDGNFPSKIRIHHYDISLNIELNLLKR